MKSLIAVFTYCPDTKRELIFTEFLKQIQPLRDKFDILVVSHSQVPKITKDLSDYIFVESDNKLIYDFDLRNKFWFKSGELFVHSSLVYKFSTHISIYSLIHYVINFARFKNYIKIHCCEYDLSLSNLSLLLSVDEKLNVFDNVMFKSEDGWVHGTYFAFNVLNLPEKYFNYSEDYMINELRKTETNMTELFTPKFLGVNDRTTHYEPSKSITQEVSLQKNDSHGNDELNWCVPIINKDSDDLYFFIYNEKGGKHNIDIIFNNQYASVQSGEVGTWKLFPIGKFSQTKKIIILIDNEIKHTIIFDEENRDKFVKHNFFYWK